MRNYQIQTQFRRSNNNYKKNSLTQTNKKRRYEKTPNFIIIKKEKITSHFIQF